MSEQIEFRFDTQLLIAGENLSSDTISEYITEHLFFSPKLLLIRFISPHLLLTCTIYY